MLAEASRAPRAAADLTRELADPTSWLALVALAALAVLLGLFRRGRRGAAATFTGAVALAALAGFLAIYWVTPLDFEYHLATSVRRVITGPVLFAAAMAPLLLSGGSRGQPPR